MKKIIQILELNNLKENKLYFITRIIVSVLIGLSFFLDSILVFKDWDKELYWSNTTNSDIYFVRPELKNFILLFAIAIISFILISIIAYIIDKRKIFKIERNEKITDKKYIIFLCIFIMWLPYLLSFFPGGYYGDVKYAIAQAIGKYKITNQQPILFTIILAVFLNTSKFITGGYQIGYILLGLSQYILMSGFIAYFIYWFYKNGINRKIIIVLTLFFGLFKLFPFYAITIWKETPFSVFVVLLCFQIADIVLSKGEKLKENKFIIAYIINILLISFFRNNGIYIAIGTTFILFFVYKKYKKFIITVLVEILVIIIIQGPIYNILKINTSYSESIGIPLQQIGYVIVNNGNITEEQMEYLNSIVSIEKVKTLYSPWNVDYIKNNSDLNIGIIKNNKYKFFKTWLELFIQNPDLYIKEYILNVTGFWNINRVYNGDFKDYINPITGRSDKNIINVYQTDIIKGLTGKTIFKSIYNNTEEQISSAIFIFIILISTTYIFKSKNYKKLLIYLPVLCTIATVLIASPIAFGLRYVYPVVIFAPLSILFSFIEKDK